MVYGIRAALYNVLLNWFSRRTSVDDLKRDFRRHELPNNDGGLPDAEFYFQSVIESKEATEKAKVYSAATLGSLSLIRQYSPIDTMRAHSRLEQALKEYADTLPRAQEPKDEADH